MADDKQRGKGAPEDEFGDIDDVEPGTPKGSDFGALTGGAEDDAGFGNLPPLSDFESSGGMKMPPLSEEGGGRFDSGLPPLGDIHAEVPRPTGGNVRPAPPGFEEKSAFDTPISDSGLDTPQTPRSTAFQDLTADSDFSPETPEIGPGPDSDLETPMFDSAFGPGSAFDRTPTPDTSAPTQAMETPIFGDRSGMSGFDADAFGASSGAGLSGGTPIPDFSPDTGMPGRAAPPPPPMMTPPPVSGERPAKGGGWGKLVVGLLVGLLIGPLVGSFMAMSLPDILSPAKAQVTELQAQVEQKEQQISQKNQEIQTLRTVAESAPKTPEGAIDTAKLTEEIAGLQAQRDQLTEEVKTAQNERDLITGDIEQLNTDYAAAKQELTELQDQTAIERSRSEGLARDVAQLEGQVGQLEEAAARAQSVKQGLLSDINRLEVLIQESSSLAPAKYAYDKRLQDVRQLKNDVAQANVVSPDLMDRYTALYEREMQIGRSREYFFAKIPVKDRYGVVHQKWAEALMNGAWSVYFRTLDGKDIGVYEKVQGTNPPEYAFRQFLPPAVEKQVEQEIMAARTPGYQERINQLAQREVNMQEGTGIQRVFDSL